jgi:tetratricopeptide (TPR) repeat protein
MAEPLEARFGRELKALGVLVESTSGGMLAFSIYSQVETRNEAADWLRIHSHIPIELVRIADGVIYLAEIIRAAPAIPRRCFLIFDIESAFPNIIGHINLYREVLFACGHALVFWVRHEGLRRIAEEAPDFWAWRSRVFDFTDTWKLELGPRGLHDSVIGHYTDAEIQQQLTSLEAADLGYFASKLAIGRRQIALHQFDKARVSLEFAVAQAERQGDKLGLAEALYLLGESKFALGLFDEANADYSRSLQIAGEIGSKEDVSAAARQLSVVALHNGDTESAHRFAEVMMQIAETSGNLTALASAHDHRGSILLGSNDIRGAEHEYLTAAKYEEQLGHRTDLAFTLGKLGHVYEEMGDLSKAKLVLARAATLFREAGSPSGEAQVVAALQRISRNHPQPSLTPSPQSESS